MDTRTLEYDHSLLSAAPPLGDNIHNVKPESSLNGYWGNSNSVPDESFAFRTPSPPPKSFLRKKYMVAILVITVIVFIGAIVGGTVGAVVRHQDQVEQNSQNSNPNSTTNSPNVPGNQAPSVYRPVYGASDPGHGIGGYDLRSTADQMFAFDFDHSGKADHFALYRPNTGTFWILQNQNGVFFPVYKQGDPGNGIGGYDLRSPADHAFAFDYEHSGRLDYLALYRPGTGTIWILQNQNATFTPVYHQGDPGIGIGGYDLKSPADRAFAFDYEHSGKLDYLALYRPGTGTIWILQNVNGVFSPVYHQGDPGIGIGGYDLKSPADIAFAFDYEHSGKLDYLALYRPGTGTIWILQNQNGTFTPVYHQGDPGIGIGGYDLKSPADLAFALDYEHSGKLDYLALYRPGTGTFWILQNQNGSFTPVYQQGDPGNGIGGYDLQSPVDRAFAFDYNSVGKMDGLTLYRPGTGRIEILTRAVT